MTSPHTINVISVPAPHSPAKGEYIVELIASPLHFADYLLVEGRYPLSLPPGTPVIPGFEALGKVIDAGGGNATKKLIGRNVACLLPAAGGWCERFRVESSHCVEIPKGMELYKCSSPFINALTASALLKIMKEWMEEKKSSDKEHPFPVVLSAGSSQTARMLVLVAQEEHINITPISLVRRPEDAAYLKALGISHVLITTDPSFDATFAGLIHQLHCTLCLDAVGGKTSSKLLNLMPEGSKLVLYGNLENQPFLEHLDGCDLTFGNKKN